jgi:hypothetical protein
MRNERVPPPRKFRPEEIMSGGYLCPVCGMSPKSEPQERRLAHERFYHKEMAKLGRLKA